MRLVIIISERQRAAVESLAKATGKPYAELVRELLKKECESHDIEWVDDLPPARETGRARAKRWT